MTIKELSELLGVSKPTVTKIIRELDIEPKKVINRYMLTDDEARRIADFLGAEIPQKLKTKNENIANIENENRKSDEKTAKNENNTETTALYERLLDSKDKEIERMAEIISTLLKANTALSMRVAFLEDRQREPVKDIEPEQAAAPTDGTETAGGKRVSLWERLTKLFRKIQ